MLGINICSILFTSLTLLQSGQGASSWAFMARHPDAAIHILILSLSSVGLLIHYPLFDLLEATGMGQGNELTVIRLGRLS